MVKIFLLSFIVSGVILITLSLIKLRHTIIQVKQILTSLPKNTYLLYNIVKYLMLFFILSYLLIFYMELCGKKELTKHITVAIFLFGGLFVYIVTILQKNIISVIKKTNLDLKKKIKQLEEVEDATIFALASQTELHDIETGKHLERTSLYVRRITEKLMELPKYREYISATYLKNISKACILHDIGKVAIPDSILKKKGPLSKQEFEIIKKHSEYGATLLDQANKKLSFNSFLSMAVNLVRYHHEKWNGTGYPEGLKGEDIPLSARIMALADVYDAMRSKRCYKKSIPHEEVVELIRKEKGKHFDPDLIDIFLKVHLDFKKISEELED